MSIHELKKALYETFIQFASFGKSFKSEEMESSKFYKLCRETKLLDKSFTKTDCDLLFTKCKSRGGRSLNFNNFLEACNSIAIKKGISPLEVYEKIVLAGGPSTGNITRPDNVRFHDDLSTYTGVYARGGPTKIDSHNMSLEHLLDRSDQDVRGCKIASTKRDERTEEILQKMKGYKEIGGNSTRVNIHELIEKEKQKAENKKEMAEGIDLSTGKNGIVYKYIENYKNQNFTEQNDKRTEEEIALDKEREIYRAQQAKIKRPVSTSSSTNTDYHKEINYFGKTYNQSDQNGLENILKARFQIYSSNNSALQKEMDSREFVRFLRDHRLLDKGKLSMNEADLIFQKSKTKGNYQKKISYDEFRTISLPLLAATKGSSQLNIMVQISKTAPLRASKSSGSTRKVRLHDDKSTYTGVYSRGGPTNIDPKITLCEMMDRSSADIRGINHNFYSGKRRGSHGSYSDYSNNGHMDDKKIENFKNEFKQFGAGAKAIMAGEANRKGGVFDRLSNKSTFTGVYARRFSGGVQGGRINGDVGNIKAKGYKGNTNTGTDVKFNDSSEFLIRRY